MSVGTGTLAMSLGLCLCAGQLVATPAAGAAPAAASTSAVSAAAAAKKRVSIRTTTSTRAIKYGKSLRITAKYLNPANAAPITSGSVRLQANRKGKWINWAAAKKLNSKGTVSFTAAPKVTGYFRTLYTGNATFAGHTGLKFKVTVSRPAASKAGRIIAEARKHVGALYLYGAAGPSRFDCSGYTMWVYRKAAGKKLPHKANLQQRHGRSVAKSKKQVGDLIVFRSGSYGTHVGIYAGSVYIYYPPHRGARIIKRKIYKDNYVVRRVA